MEKREDLRNVAIVAHVDHGKTTLVDAMLWQEGAFDAHLSVEQLGTQILDSGDLEREKGITILAKNTAVNYAGSAAQAAGQSNVVINVVDTPGHADFSGEVERALSMVDGVVLLVDAAEGPRPQTRFVLRKALEAGLPVIPVINKVDKPDARISEVVSETQELLLELAADIEAAAGHEIAGLEGVLEIPVVYISAKAGRASLTPPANGELPAETDLEALFASIMEYVPAPTFDPEAPLVAQVTNLDASPFLGRLALVRVYSGELHKGAWVGLSAGPDEEVVRVHISELLRTTGLERESAPSAGPGDIVAVAGVPNITIGETLVDPEEPRPLPPIHIDEPAIAMTIGVNTSPLAGGKDHKVTARQVRDRLTQELVGNVSIRVLPTERPDAWEVRDRGELALAVLVETMRREGFELTVGKPQVVRRVVNGEVHEPWQFTTIDVPEEYLGTVTQLMAERRGQLETMANHGTGWVRMEFLVPARGLIGFRNQFLTQTRGTGIAASISAGYRPWAGPIAGRIGSLVADRSGKVTAFSLQRLESRGTFFVDPGEEVYEGQVVGENPRREDMDVNVVKAKEMTNMRSATADVFETLQARRKMTLEEYIEFAADDECIEVTPEKIRLRKIILDSTERYRAANRKAQAR